MLWRVAKCPKQLQETCRIVNSKQSQSGTQKMKKLAQFLCVVALVLVVATTAVLADIYDRCTLVDDNTVIVKLKGGVSIKLVRKGQDIFLHQKSADDGR